MSMLTDHETALRIAELETEIDTLRAPQAEHLTGELTHAGTMQIVRSAAVEDMTGVFIRMTVDELRAVKHLPMYRRVAVIDMTELALNAKMLARQCDLAREAETQLASALEKDARKTREYNILVAENRALLADKARLDFLDSQVWPDLPRPNYTPPIVQLVAKSDHDPQGEWVNVDQSARAALDDAMRGSQTPPNLPK